MDDLIRRLSIYRQAVLAEIARLDRIIVAFEEAQAQGRHTVRLDL